ncbi:hypothetical protein M407DRAFT_240819 [Tulasnella calospora MUT 4182]|uniref:DUF1772-domain-containing protein n=1 Tax=Tulasnella calospora MUT 4182 TaxID=1051891 RepID=A0A0C3QW26_9AGAM|nr:hypothetical protein M407DRAFT_240819 [Tulasnella calospora MUT 4182]
MHHIYALFTPAAMIRLGVLGAGFSAGYSFASSHGSVQSILQTPTLTASQIAMNWDKVYTRGVKLVPPVAFVSSLAFLSAAYRFKGPLIATAFGISPKLQLNIAAGLLLCVFPWTYFRMLPGLQRLQAYSASAEKGALIDGPEAKGIIADVEDWHWANGVRALAFGGACVLGLTVL